MKFKYGISGWMLRKKKKRKYNYLLSLNSKVSNLHSISIRHFTSKILGPILRHLDQIKE